MKLCPPSTVSDMPGPLLLVNGPCVKVNVTADDRLVLVAVDVIAGSANSLIMTLLDVMVSNSFRLELYSSFFRW